MPLTQKTGLYTGAGLLLLVTTILASPASAQTKTFDLTYSGSSFGNSASATGFVTIDESKLNNPGITFQSSSPFVTAFSLTVSGASSGNGTFSFADYTPMTGGDGNLGFLLDTNGGTLDLSKQLIGQATSGAPYGTPGGNGGDFNVFANSVGQAAGAPQATSPFRITTDNFNGDKLRLTGFAPAPVPESSSAASFGLLLALGLGGVAVARRKKIAA